MAAALLGPADSRAGTAPALPLTGEETSVIADGVEGEASTLIGAGAPLALAPHKRRVPFRFLLAVAGALLLVLLLLLGLASGSGPNPSSTTPSTTTVLPTTPPTAQPVTTVPPATKSTTPPARPRRGKHGKND
jgi:hypothetical protein